METTDGNSRICRPRWPLVWLYVLAITVGLIALRIEFLNWLAGSPLPLGEGVGQLRETVVVNDVRWREWHDLRENAVRPGSGRDLTSAEVAQMESALARNVASNRLKSWVGSAGLLQYLLIPLAAVMLLIAVVAKPDRRRARGILPAALLVMLAAASLLYRGYFGAVD